MLYGIKNPHGGDVYNGNVRLDYSVNLNPLGTPETVKQAVRDAAERSCRYPDPYCSELIRGISEKENIPCANILCSNGGAELIYAFCDALMPERPACVVPSFSEYSAGVGRNGRVMAGYRLKGSEGFELDEGILDFIDELDPDVLFLCNPNNPDGRLIPESLLNDILEKCDNNRCTLFLDECFLDLSDGYDRSLISLTEEHPGLFILKAFTKNYAMAGVRLGYGVCSDRQLLEKTAERLQPWNVSVMAQEAGLAALKESSFVSDAREIIRTERKWLADELERAGFGVNPSQANYMMIKLPEEQRFFPGKSLGEAMLEKGILIRSCDSFEGIDRGWYRICVRCRKDNEELMHAVRECINSVKK